MLAEFSSISFQHDHLLVERLPFATSKVIVAEGQNLLRGAVLGRAQLGAISSAAKSGGNAGGGALTLDPTEPVLIDAVAGPYEARRTETAIGGGQFTVTNPEGVILGTVAVGENFANKIKFTIVNGAPDFELEDGLDITVAPGSSKAILPLAAARDGSQVSDSILVSHTDITGGHEEAMSYIRGDFNKNALTLGAGHTVDLIEDGLRVKGIWIRDAIPA